MEIIIDAKAGYCAGVRRVVHMTEMWLSKGYTVYTLGELIHNDKEIERLKKKGLVSIERDAFENPECLKEMRDKKVVLRAHGESESLHKRMAELGLDVVNGTCPIVGRLQLLVKHYYTNAYQIIIVGKTAHPEVAGLMGYCDGTAKVIMNISDLKDFNPLDKTVIFAQTTVSQDLLFSIADVLIKQYPALHLKAITPQEIRRSTQEEHVPGEVELCDTVCRFVVRRRDELREFLAGIDTLLFVGGKKSSNTHQLFEFCSKIINNSHFVEDEQEIDLSWFTGSKRIGVSGSASTPRWLMENVRDFLALKLGAGVPVSA